MKMMLLISALCLACGVQGMMAPASGPMMMDMMAPAMAPSMAPMMSSMMMDYNVTLLPQNQIPGVPNSGAMGYAVLEIMPDSNEIMYNIGLFNCYGPIAGHIHAGNKTSNGDVIVPLYAANPATVNTATPVYGTLVSGMVNPANFTGPAKGMSLQAFIDMYVSTGDSYVNVHSKAHPDGLIRGQIDDMAMMSGMAPAMGPSMMMMAPSMAPMPMGMPAST